MGGLNLEMCKSFMDTISFLHLRGDKSLLGELKLCGRVILISTISLFHFLKNSQHSEKLSNLRNSVSQFLKHIINLQFLTDQTQA